MDEEEFVKAITSSQKRREQKDRAEEREAMRGLLREEVRELCKGREEGRSFAGFLAELENLRKKEPVLLAEAVLFHVSFLIKNETVALSHHRNDLRQKDGGGRLCGGHQAGFKRVVAAMGAGLAVGAGSSASRRPQRLATPLNPLLCAAAVSNGGASNEMVSKKEDSALGGVN